MWEGSRPKGRFSLNDFRVTVSRAKAASGSIIAADIWEISLSLVQRAASVNLLFWAGGGKVLTAAVNPLDCFSGVFVVIFRVTKILETNQFLSNKKARASSNLTEVAFEGIAERQLIKASKASPLRLNLSKFKCSMATSRSSTFSRPSLKAAEPLRI